jgi:uncharacterized protein YdcH (DUF465 family)
MPEVSFSRDQLVGELLNQDDEFRALFKEHQTLEDQLVEFGRRRYLNTEEEMERKKLQKVKLQGKDRMEEILRKYSSVRMASAA